MDFVEFGSGPGFAAAAVIGADLGDEFFGDGVGIVLEGTGGAEVSEDGRDLQIGEDVAEGGHGSVVLIAIDGDGTGEAGEDDFYQALGAVLHPVGIDQGGIDTGDAAAIALVAGLAVAGIDPAPEGVEVHFNRTGVRHHGTPELGFVEVKGIKVTGGANDVNSRPEGEPHEEGHEDEGHGRKVFARLLFFAHELSMDPLHIFIFEAGAFEGVAGFFSQWAGLLVGIFAHGLLRKLHFREFVILVEAHEVSDQILGALGGHDFIALGDAPGIDRGDGIGMGSTGRADGLDFVEKCEWRHGGPIVDALGEVEVLVLPEFAVAGSDIGEVGAGAHGSEHDAVLKDVVAGNGLAVAPAPFEVGAKALAADLLGMAVEAAEFAVDPHTAFSGTGEAGRVNRFVGEVVPENPVALGILIIDAGDAVAIGIDKGIGGGLQVTQLDVGGEHDSGPGKGEDEEDAEKK